MKNNYYNLNHVSMNLFKNGLAAGPNFSDDIFHPGKDCIKYRQTRLPFSSNKIKTLSKNTLYQIHSDLCGPMRK